MHTNPLKCKVCDQLFTRLRRLNEHIRFNNCISSTKPNNLTNESTNPGVAAEQPVSTAATAIIQWPNPYSLTIPATSASQHPSLERSSLKMNHFDDDSFSDGFSDALMPDDVNDDDMNDDNVQLLSSTMPQLTLQPDEQQHTESKPMVFKTVI